VHALAAARAVQRPPERGLRGLDREGELVAAREDDLPHERDRAVVGARDDDAPAFRVRALEPLPALEAYRRRQTLDVEMRDSEDLEIVPRLRDEGPADQRLAVASLRRDDGEVRAHRAPRPRGEQVGDGPEGLRERPVGRVRQERHDPLGRPRERRREHP